MLNKKIVTAIPLVFIDGTSPGGVGVVVGVGVTVGSNRQISYSISVGDVIVITVVRSVSVRAGVVTVGVTGPYEITEVTSLVTLTVRHARTTGMVSTII